MTSGRGIFTIILATLAGFLLTDLLGPVYALFAIMILMIVARFLSDFLPLHAWRKAEIWMSTFTHYSDSLGIKIQGHAKLGKVKAIHFPGWIFGKLHPGSSEDQPDLILDANKATYSIKLIHGHILVFDPAVMTRDNVRARLISFLSADHCLMLFVPTYLQGGYYITNAVLMTGKITDIKPSLLDPILDHA